MNPYQPGTPCTNENEHCKYLEPHDHGGFDCDPTCPCYEISGLKKPEGR